MSRDKRAVELKEATGVSYSMALRFVRGESGRLAASPIRSRAYGEVGKR